MPNLFDDIIPSVKSKNLFDDVIPAQKGTANLSDDAISNKQNKNLFDDVIPDPKKSSNLFDDIIPAKNEQKQSKNLFDDVLETKKKVEEADVKTNFLLDLVKDSTPFMQQADIVTGGRAWEFPKGAFSFAISTPQAVGGLMRDFGERAEEKPFTLSKYADSPLVKGVIEGAEDFVLSANPTIRMLKQNKEFSRKIFQNTQIDESIAKAGEDLIEANRSWIKKTFPNLAPKDDKFSQFLFNMGSGAATLATALGLSALTKSPHAASVAFGLYQKGQIYQEAREKGFDPTLAGRISTVAGAIEGSLEYLGLDAFLKATGGTLSKAFIRAGTEAFQEFSQQLGENITTQVTGVRGYDGINSIFQGAGQAALIGALLGGSSSTVFDMLQSGETNIVKELEDSGLDTASAQALAKLIAEKQFATIQQMADEQIAGHMRELKGKLEGVEKLKKVEMTNVKEKLGLTEELSPEEIDDRIISKVEEIEALQQSGLDETDPEAFRAQGEQMLAEIDRLEGMKGQPKEDTAEVRVEESKEVYGDLIEEAKKYDSAEEFVGGQSIVYHQSQSKESITELKEGMKKPSYSQAQEGIYFSPNKDLVASKYGKEGGQLVEAVLQPKKTLDLGDKDAMYFDGTKVNYGEIVVENFKRTQQGLKPLPEPDIQLSTITKKAKKWLLKQDYDSVEGMKGEMWSAPEIVVLDPSIIKTRSQLIDIWNKAQEKTKPEQIDKQTGEGYTVSEGESNYYEEQQKPAISEGELQDTDGRKRVSKSLSASPLKVKYKEQGHFFFPNEKISSPADIAFAFQSLKNEAVERFYVVGLKDNIPVCVEPISIGIIDAAMANPYDAVHLLQTKNADSYFLIHNHPSGKVEASQPDLALNKSFIKALTPFGLEHKGHVIINDTKFGFISSSNQASENPLIKFEGISKKVPQYSKYIEWIEAKGSGKQINSPEKVFDYIKSLNQDWEHNACVIYADSDLKIRTAELLPHQEVNVGNLAKTAIANRSTLIILANSKLEFKQLKNLKKTLKNYPIELLDVIEFSKDKSEFYSYQSAGLIREKEAEYQKSKRKKIRYRKQLNYALGQIRDLVESAEAGKRFTNEFGEWGGTQSTFPKYFQNKGYSKKEILEAIDKGIAGKKLGVKQQEIFDIALHEAVKIDEELREEMPEKEPVAPSAKKILGIKPSREKIVLNKVEAFRRQLRELEKVSKAGFKEGAKEGAKNAKQKILDKLSEKQKDIEAVKGLIYEYIKTSLPQKSRGRFLTVLSNAKTERDVAKAFARIDKEAERVQRRNVLGEIKERLRKVEKAKNIAIEYKGIIKGIVSDIELAGHRQSTIKSLEATKRWIEKQKALGRDVVLPEYVYDSLKILARKPASALSVTELEIIADKMELAQELGEIKLEAKKTLYEASKGKILSELLEADVRKIGRKEETTKGVGEKLNIIDKLKNTFIKAKNHAQLMDKVTMPMDVFFDFLDGGKDYKGAFFKNFKQREDIKYSDYLAEKDKIVEEARREIKASKLNDQNYERIGVYAIDQQKGGREKLHNIGLTDQEIDAIKLIPKELNFYKLMRKNLDGLRPRIAEMMRNVYNEEIGEVENYFSFMTDFEAMSELEAAKRVTESIEHSGIKKNPELGFTKKRTGAGQQKIKINALDIYFSHIDNALYAIHVGAENKMLFEIANSQEIGEKIGERGQTLLLQWLDLMSRKGGSAEDQRIKLLDILRRNVGVSKLGFKLTSALIQPTALLDGAAQIGHYAFKGANDVGFSGDWRKFLRENFAELKDRIGDDPAFRELAKNKAVSKAQKAGLSALRWLDGLTASAIVAGAYQKYLKDNNLKMDFDNPNPDAIAYAQLMLRKTQASGQFKDIPLAISKGILGEKFRNRSIAKAFFQFQTFMLTRWSQIRHDMPANIRQGKPGKTFGIGMFLMSATIMEMAIRDLSYKLLASLFGWEEKEKDYGIEFLKTMAGNIPWVSQAMSTVVYGSYPVPAFSAIGDVIKSLNYLGKSKKPDTKTKWAIISALEIGGTLGGMPGTAQTSQIVKRKSAAEKEKKKRKTRFGDFNIDMDFGFKSDFGSFASGF